MNNIDIDVFLDETEKAIDVIVERLKKLMEEKEVIWRPEYRAFILIGFQEGTIHIAKKLASKLSDVHVHVKTVKDE